MNKFYLFAFTVLLSIPSWASNFHLQVSSSSKMTVEINSQSQSNQNNNYTFANLPGGNTIVKVFDAWTGNVIFFNTVNIAVNSDVYATLDFSGNMNVYMVTPLTSNTPSANVGTVTYSTNGSIQINQGPHQNATNNQSFNDFLTMIKEESMDSGKLKLGQNYVAKTFLTVYQIKQICQEFSFDSYRLEFAKSAYATCTDKGNYVLLKDVFSFTSNYNALMDHVNSH